ncbi:hypothetical protein JW824_01545 [bacterium]|nr:hypothetical protein [bacterium]RQV98460.1 MAG: hypothetical protein EH221_01925 [bacterium]
MFEELNEKLSEVKEKLREKKRFENLLMLFRQKLDGEKLHLKKLTSVLNKENQDVKKLEGLTITALFHQILGTKEDKLDKERQEVIAAKLKVDSCKNTISSIEREIISFNNKIQTYGNIESEYKALFKEKETKIIQKKDRQMIDLTEKLADLKSDHKETKEAILAGNDVLNELEKILSSLRSAGNWGTFDLLGGGLIATAVKHSKIDRAKQSVEHAQYLLHRFHEELSDIQIEPQSDIGIEMGSFTTFADYFFDGLIFDWAVQSKIHRSLENTKAMQKDVNEVIQRLKDKLKTIQNQINITEVERKKQIENKV